jgi:hypothetical protein
MPSDLAGEASSTHLLTKVVQKIFGPEASSDTLQGNTHKQKIETN